MPEAGAWMPMYWADYLADTLELRAEEHGVYLLMMGIAWRRPDGALPNDMDLLKRMLGGCCRDMHGNRFNRIVPGILERFWTLGEDGKWRQKRIGKEKEKAKKLAEKRSESAKKRWSQQNKNSDLEDASALHRARDTLQSHILDSSLRSESETPAGVDQPDLDALFYRRGKALLGKKAGGQLTKLRAACGSVGVALEIIDQAQHKDSPAEYVAGCIRNRGNGALRHGTNHRNQRASVVDAVRWLDERRQPEEDREGTRSDEADGEGRKLE